MAAVPPVVDLSASPHARLRPLPLSAFRIGDGFWSERLTQLRAITLRQQYEQCERSGRIDHFRRASGRKPIAEFVGRFYDDSDVYKWLEACAYALAANADPELEAIVDSVIDDIAAAQRPDGYVNTYFTFERESERWDNLTRMHQLYCAGHLIQAAIAHHRATGKPTLLGVAVRFADLICATFTQTNRGTDGHEEIELALAELYRHTGDRKYLAQCVYFLDQRGQQPPVLDGSIVFQDHLPVRELRDIVGHAVRATYLAIGMTDAYAETGDEAMWTAVQALWESTFSRKAYVTGGLGAHWHGESFGADYELPNERAYAETCAAIGGFMWNWRMLHITADAKYADWMETALYNGILAGLSLDGTRYFYQNPLANDGTHRRAAWFSTACCPPNIARLLLSLPGYVASVSSGGFWLHHYVSGELQVDTDALTVTARVDTTYPLGGQVRLELTSLSRAAQEATLFLRVPAWCMDPSVRVNGTEVAIDTRQRGYASVQRTWRVGDVVELHLTMSPRRIYSHPHVQANAGRVALARGPLVYCLEGADQPNIDLRDVSVTSGTHIGTERAPDALGGIVALHAIAGQAKPSTSALYDGPPAGSHTALTVTAVPYYAWANREPGQMQVWLREAPPGHATP